MPVWKNVGPPDAYLIKTFHPRWQHPANLMQVLFIYFYFFIIARDQRLHFFSLRDLRSFLPIQSKTGSSHNHLASYYININNKNVIL